MILSDRTDTGDLLGGCQGCLGLLGPRLNSALDAIAECSTIASKSVIAYLVIRLHSPSALTVISDGPSDSGTVPSYVPISLMSRPIEKESASSWTTKLESPA